MPFLEISHDCFNVRFNIFIADSDSGFDNFLSLWVDILINAFLPLIRKNN